jgi:DNA-binding transcriptional MerR regulator
VKVDSNCTGVKGGQEGMGLINNEFFESNEKLPKDELKELLGINRRTFMYYREIGFLKGTKTRRKGKYIFSPNDVKFLSFIRDLRCVGLPLSEIKKIKEIHKIFEKNNKRKLLVLNESLEELFDKIEFKKRELEQLRKDIFGFKNDLKNFKNLSAQFSETQIAKKRVNQKLISVTKIFGGRTDSEVVDEAI